MEFTETAVEGCFLIEVEPRGDDRGFFARGFCRREFEAHGLNPNVAQANLSFNRDKGTLRGMHFQMPPHAENKLVRCTRGSIFDVALDLREESRTYLRWAGATLSAENHSMLYVSEGCAHGYLTLEDDSEVFYLVSEFYAPDCEGGVLWNDPAFGIGWPAAPAIVSERDRSHPLFEESTFRK